MMLSSYVMGEQFFNLSSTLVTERHANKYFHNLVSSNLTKIVQKQNKRWFLHDNPLNDLQNYELSGGTRIYLPAECAYGAFHRY